MSSTAFLQHNTTNTRDVRTRHMLRAAHHLLLHYYLPYFCKKISENLKIFGYFLLWTTHHVPTKRLIKDLHLIRTEHHKTYNGFNNALPNEQRIEPVHIIYTFYSDFDRPSVVANHSGSDSPKSRFPYQSPFGRAGHQAGTGTHLTSRS